MEYKLPATAGTVPDGNTKGHAIPDLFCRRIAGRSVVGPHRVDLFDDCAGDYASDKGVNAWNARELFCRRHAIRHCTPAAKPRLGMPVPVGVQLLAMSGKNAEALRK